MMRLSIFYFDWCSQPFWQPCIDSLLGSAFLFKNRFILFRKCSGIFVQDVRFLQRVMKAIFSHHKWHWFEFKKIAWKQIIERHGSDSKIATDALMTGS